MSSDLPSASVVSSSAKLYAVIISSNAKLHVVNKAAITTHQFIIFHYRIAPSRPTFGVFSCFNFYFCHAESFNRGEPAGFFKFLRSLTGPIYSLYFFSFGDWMNSGTSFDKRAFSVGYIARARLGIIFKYPLSSSALTILCVLLTADIPRPSVMSR